MVWRGMAWWPDCRTCTKFSYLQYLVKDGMVLCFRDSVLSVWIEYVEIVCGQDCWSRQTRGSLGLNRYNWRGQTQAQLFSMIR